MNKITENHSAKVAAAVAYYKKQSKNSGLRGSLIGKVAGLFDISPRDLMRSLVDNQVPQANTSAHMSEEKKKKKKKKAKGATPTPTNPGYSANAGLAATGGVGMGGGSGAAGASESVIKSVKNKLDEHFDTILYDGALRLHLGESVPEVIDTVASKKASEKKKSWGDKLKSAGDNMRQTGRGKIKQGIADIGALGEDVSNEYDYEFAKVTNVQQIKDVVRKYDTGRLDKHSRDKLYFAAKERAKDFGRFGTMHEGWEDWDSPDDIGVDEFGPEVGKAERIVNQIEDHYNVTWKEMSDEIDFSDMGLGPDADAGELGYDISGQYPAKIKRNDGQPFTSGDLDNLGAYGDAWNLVQREVMSNQVEIYPVGMNEYSVQFILGLM